MACRLHVPWARDCAGLACESSPPWIGPLWWRWGDWSLAPAHAEAIFILGGEKWQSIARERLRGAIGAQCAELSCAQPTNVHLLRPARRRSHSQGPGMPGARAHGVRWAEAVRKREGRCQRCGVFSSGPPDLARAEVGLPWGPTPITAQTKLCSAWGQKKIAPPTVATSIDV